MISASAQCAQHAGVKALRVCARCGMFLCDACTRDFDRKPVCAACEVLLRGGPPSMWAIAARNTMFVAWFVPAACVVGALLRQWWMIAGLFLSVPIAVVSGVLALIELVRSPAPRGRSTARGVLVALAVHIAVAVCFVMELIAMTPDAPEQR